MTLVLCAAILFTSLLAAFVFDGATTLCLMAAAAAAVLGGAWLLFLRRVKLLRGLSLAAAIVLAAICLYIPARATAYGARDYQARLEELTDRMEDEEYEEADELHAQIVEVYGETDAMRYLYGIRALAEEDASLADRCASSFEDRTSPLFYLLREGVFRKIYENNPQECILHLRWLYQEAADLYPDWSYMSRNAGILLFENGSYDVCRYYLLNAYFAGDEPDGKLLYYLGASHIETGNYDKGLALLNEALNFDLDDETVRNLLWYAEKAGWEAEE